jgi:energy-converting hydrogenase B subunit Q
MEGIRNLRSLPAMDLKDLDHREKPDLALSITSKDQPGVLHRLTGVIASHSANIVYVDITQRRNGNAVIYFELQDVTKPQQLVEDLRALDIVYRVEETPTFYHIFGKRVIVIGGGAQVGQVVLGAVSEADRHNIRGERISVDTIPLVGEEELAAAVRAVARLPRASCLVLAGALMGGEITKAVREIRDEGIIVISLNMAGSVPDAADLVISDPVQAGVMAVMAVARTAKFDIRKQVGKRY